MFFISENITETHADNTASSIDSKENSPVVSVSLLKQPSSCI